MVKCLKYNRDSNHLFWLEQPDVDTVTKETIEMILPEPLRDRRGSYMTFCVFLMA